MKKFRKLASTALALILAMALSLTAFAAPGDGDDTTTPPETPTGALDFDKTVSIEGLQPDDTVEFYQVLAWNGDWVIAEDVFKSQATELDKVAHGVKEGDTVKNYPIDATLAGALGVIANGTNVSPKGSATAGADGKAVYSVPGAGLYMAIITAKDPVYVYNPVFVASDFNPDNASTGIVLNATNLNYNHYGVAKVSKLDLTKTANTVDNDPDTVALGDDINFTVTTIVPVYADNYTNPKFIVSDKLSDGLSLDRATIQVSLPEGMYDILPASGEDYDFAIDVHADYLHRDGTATPITITYTAKVVSADTTSVTPEDNTVTLKFTHNPADSEDFGILRDKTNHYTFDIDGTLFGNTEYESSEVVKIGIDATGKEITSTQLTGNHKWVGALEGAEFKLYKSYTSATDNVPYVNSVITAETVFVSGADGRIHIQGLDAGTYYLVETKAPAGYIAAQDPVKIEIIPTVVSIHVTDKETVKGKEVEVAYDTDVLEGYDVKINGQTTASYTLTNDHDGIVGNEETGYGDIVGNDGENESNPGGAGKIVNTQGTELPSTGGIGTTIFYIVGIALIVGAGVLLVVKKRVGGKEEA